MSQRILILGNNDDNLYHPADVEHFAEGVMNIPGRAAGAL